MKAFAFFVVLILVSINTICVVKSDLCTSSVCEYYWEITEWITGMYGPHYPVWSVNGTFWYLNESDFKNHTVPEANISHVIGLDGYQRIIPLINGSMPGPTIEVYEGSEIIVHITNKMANEATSFHWHGIYQHGTPWMDGVSTITQCGILPGDTFTYRFIADPKGTHFYHSHHGLQRPDGLFGALIIHENPNTTTNSLHEKICDSESTLMINDWFHEHNEDIFLNRVGPGFRSNGPWQVADTWGFNVGGKIASETPFTAVLFNGKGRMELNKTYYETPLEYVNVEKDISHCLRLIHSGMERTFEFSIDYHKFILISSDGFDIEPSYKLDSLILTPGETYDIVFNTTNKKDNYFIRAKSLEANYDHHGWAVLHYNGAINGTLPTKESNVNGESDICKNRGCLTANCPLPVFPQSWNKTCLYLTNFTNYDKSDNFIEYPKSRTMSDIFLNFAFEPLAINRRAFTQTSSPLLTQYDDATNSSSYVPCNASFCDYNDGGCNCTHILDIPFNYSVQLTFTNFGRHAATMHPIHLHGHSFQILKIGLPSEYNLTDGRILSNYSADIKCINGTGCSQQEWIDYNQRVAPYLQTKQPLRKDTVVVMPGGYVTVQLITDNPGFWHLHCHMTQHLYFGLGMVIQEGFDYLKYFPPPDNFPTCGDFDYNDDYMWQSIDAYNDLFN